jgi:hypothetical protein
MPNNNAGCTSVIRKSQSISVPTMKIPTTIADHVQHAMPDPQSQQQNDT